MEDYQGKLSAPDNPGIQLERAGRQVFGQRKRGRNSGLWKA